MAEMTLLADRIGTFSVLQSCSRWRYHLVLYLTLQAETCSHIDNTYMQFGQSVQLLSLCTFQFYDDTSNETENDLSDNC